MFTAHLMHTLACLTLVSSESGIVTFPWVFDITSGDCLVELPFVGGGAARVTLDTGSPTLGIAVPGCETVDPAQSVQPLVVPPVLVHTTVPNSTIQMHYGSGGWDGAMASGALAIPGTLASTPVVFGAILSVEPGGFPVGGPSNIAGILGLTWPNPEGARSRPYSTQPYCLNGSRPSFAGGQLNCNPASDAVPNLPLLQQLLEHGVVGRSTLHLSYEGNVVDRTRHGTLTLGASPPTGAAAAALVPLVKYLGLAFAGFYVVAVDELTVDRTGRKFGEAALSDGSMVGGFIVDTGEFGLQLPQPVLTAVLQALRDGYRGPETLGGVRMDRLLASGNTSTLGETPPLLRKAPALR